MQADEENQLLENYLQTRSPHLREALILQHVRLVHYVLARMGVNEYTHTDYEDLVSQGLLGLIEAVDNFNAVYSTRFSTYATHRIRGKILDHLRQQDWLSRSARKRARQVQNSVSELWHELGRAPNDAELAQRLDMSQSEVDQALVDASHVMVSLDAPLATGDDEIGSLYESIEDDSQENPADHFDRQEAQAEMLEALKRMPERDRLILSLYYYEELTLSEIGEVIGVSESRVCQLHGRALLNLKGALSVPEKKQARTPASHRTTAVASIAA